MHQKTLKVSFLLYLSFYSGICDAGLLDTINDIVEGIKSAKKEYYAAEETADTWVNDTEKDINTGAKSIPLVPQLEEYGVLCSPCQMGVNFLSYYITFDVYVPLALVTVCPIIYAFDENAHNLLACEIVVAGAVVFSYFGNTKKVCRRLGMCQLPSSASTKTKRSPVEGHGMDLDEVLKLMPNDLHDFSKKLEHLSPVDYIKVEHGVVEMIGEIQKHNPQRLLELLKEVAPFYQ